jgi:predicted GIY-YIG superfamily endonuclease
MGRRAAQRRMQTKRPRNEDGFVYVLTNPGHPEMVKIGYTDDMERRMRDLNSRTGQLYPFVCAYAFRTSNPRELEKKVHEHLKYARVRQEREFFRIHVDRVKDAIDELTHAEIGWRDRDRLSEEELRFRQEQIEARRLAEAEIARAKQVEELQQAQDRWQAELRATALRASDEKLMADYASFTTRRARVVLAPAFVLALALAYLGVGTATGWKDGLEPYFYTLVPIALFYPSVENLIVTHVKRRYPLLSFMRERGYGL